MKAWHEALLLWLSIARVRQDLRQVPSPQFQREKMTPSSKHDTAARRIARRRNAEYNTGPGPDIVTPKAVIEVETAGTIKDGLRQLQGYRGPVYIAGADNAAVLAALEGTNGTTVGVMDPQGNIMKRSTRKRK